MTTPEVPSLTSLAMQSCTPSHANMSVLTQTEVVALLSVLPQWQYQPEAQTIHAVYHFQDYAQVLEFVNAVANIAIENDHHPQVSFAYKQCLISYTTHAINGVSENDIICAAKIESLFSNHD